MSGDNNRQRSTKRPNSDICLKISRYLETATDDKGSAEHTHE